MDDAASEIFSARFFEEEGTMSSFQGREEAITSNGLFCSLYVDRSSHYWHTPEAGGKFDKGKPTQFGRESPVCRAAVRTLVVNGA